MKTFQILAVIILSSIISPVMAQVTFIIDQLPASTPAGDSIYIAGDFNGWTPGNPADVMHKNAENKWEITLAAQPDLTSIAYKFTRGTWTTVEKGATGEEIPNRGFTYGNGDVVHITIYNWADNGSGGSTAAANVVVMSTNFYMPQLDRYRRIWLYFPPGYETSGLNYPVLYMHDGQNLFDAATAFAGEWEVDETLNNFAGQGIKVPIVVGIDNGPDRIGEYTPWTNPDYGGGDGEKYIRFIVETLKPYIDQNYRTLPGRENTGLMGSSLGGLISHYGGLAYQNVFSKAGLFSPSYWYSDSIWAFTHQNGKQEDMRFYQLCGDSESSGMVGDMQRMNDSLVSIGFSQDNIFNKIVAGGHHNEKLWREGFGEAYLWLFNTYADAVSEPFVRNKIILYPNPVRDFLMLPQEGMRENDSIQILDIQGHVVRSFINNTNSEFDVSELAMGTYLVKCMKNGNSEIIKFIKQ
jgi:predicted alpha/beta superfamily hydrolase